jgi:hypothetical protein
MTEVRIVEFPVNHRLGPFAGRRHSEAAKARMRVAAQKRWAEIHRVRAVAEAFETMVTRAVALKLFKESI